MRNKMLWHDLADGDLYLVANGEHYVVMVTQTAARISAGMVKLDGEMVGSLVVVDLDRTLCTCVRDGDGDGDAVRLGNGQGWAIRRGGGRGSAVKLGGAGAADRPGGGFGETLNLGSAVMKSPGPMEINCFDVSFVVECLNHALQRCWDGVPNGWQFGMKCHHNSRADVDC